MHSFPLPSSHLPIRRCNHLPKWYFQTDVGSWDWEKCSHHVQRCECCAQPEALPPRVRFLGFVDPSDGSFASLGGFIAEVDVTAARSDGDRAQGFGLGTSSAKTAVENQKRLAL